MNADAAVFSRCAEGGIPVSCDAFARIDRAFEDIRVRLLADEERRKAKEKKKQDDKGSSPGSGGKDKAETAKDGSVNDTPATGTDKPEDDPDKPGQIDAASLPCEDSPLDQDGGKICTKATRGSLELTPVVDTSESSVSQERFSIDRSTFRSLIVDFFRNYGQKFRRCVWEIFAKDRDGNKSNVAEVMAKPSSTSFPYGRVTIYDSISGAQAFVDNNTGEIGLRKSYTATHLMDKTVVGPKEVFFRNVAHEYANYLSWFHTADGSTFGVSGGISGDADVGYGAGVASVHADDDTGARMEKCVWGNVAY